MASSSTQAIASGDLIDLVSSSGSATIYPSDDAIISVLQARFRADLPYTRLGSSHLVVVNPYKTLANVNNVSAKEYEDRCYKDTSLPMVDSPKPLQPHVYDIAARIYLLLRRRNESHAILARGITGSGKSASLRLMMNQLLRLSTHSTKEAKVADQIKALTSILDSFGNAKTLMNANASRHGRYLELHFSERGRIASAKVLTFGLDKSRLSRLTHEERSFHVFYQFLAGATTTERDALNIEDPSDYALLASSGTYRLPAGPFSDDSIAMGELRMAMRTIGFKPKTMSSIFTFLIAILQLGNLQFADGDANDVPAYVVNTQVLDSTARLLGVASEDLAQALTNKTSYVRKELYTVILNARQAAAQRDHLVRDLYAILFAFVVETINNRVCPKPKDPPPATQIVLFDQPGFQTRGPSGTQSMSLTGQLPLITSTYGQNSFDEFCLNFCDELLHSYVQRHTFEDNIGWNERMSTDGVALPSISTIDNSACIELLRGTNLSETAQRKPGGILGSLSKACSSYKSGKGGDHRDEDLLQDLVTKFGVHASFVANAQSSGGRNQFGINHYAGVCNYDVSDFIEKDADVLDSAFVNILRNSTDAFVGKLFVGPSLSVERHYKDENILVQAQVSSRPLRQPTSGEDQPMILDEAKTYPVTTQLNVTLSQLFLHIDKMRLWNLSCIRPNDSGSSNSFDKRRVKAQIRSLLLPDLTSRKSVDYIADYELSVFCERYVPRMQGSEIERIAQCARANGWTEGLDYVLGHRHIWLSYAAWKSVEDALRNIEKEARKALQQDDDEDKSFLGVDDAMDDSGLAPPGQYNGSADNLLSYRGPPTTESQHQVYGSGGLATPSQREFTEEGPGSDPWSEWDRKESYPATTGKDELLVNQAPNAVEEVPSSRTRRWWLWACWACTWWIPTFVLSSVGRMKRPDVRLAWREKFTIFFLIFLFNAIVIFYIVEFGRLLCPNFDKAWASNEVAQHTGDNDWWVSVQGSVYDLSNFVHGDHSDIAAEASNSPDVLDDLAGTDMTYYFPVPLVLGCPGLVSDNTLAILPKNFTEDEPNAMHQSGNQQQNPATALHQNDWYTSNFLPTMRQFRKGPLVWTTSDIQAQAQDTNIQKIWAVYEGDLFDLTDYVNTLTTYSTNQAYNFLNQDIVNLFKQRAGQDITSVLSPVLAQMDPTTRNNNINCMKNVFFLGQTDFRKTARCQVQNYILITVSAVLMASMALKFLAALQLAPKRNPELQDKFVLCQVPCYTESEESLRRTIDSLAALNYDDKRKLIFIICDGNIIGSGNDRTTPRIVLDILGIDPKLDPEPLLFKSIGEGSKALNYGKVYSGLYEFEGHVVPYMVVVKVGKPSERSKPGNRGKRDSQILLLHYLNRVHFDAPMSPLELEIYHQMRNVIGIDPAFYEYIFTVDADTLVTPESLNRLVASSSDDSSVIGVCGETKLHNEEGSWWTMIQVYEYYISHHLSKAFESLFGSVSCLPGCFSLYRIRTADKGRPIIISNRIIDEYAEPNVDTLHKKNLFSLGEDRFLTTLLMKHFPSYKTKFCADAIARTVAPESWRILFSQRRRWINSTVHNLCELVLLPELIGFCCFSMRFFVFVDLLSTLILPSTVVYLVYLVIVVSTGASAFPLISIIMIACVYGLQALIFILKREFMLVGWMVVYILSYPIYSFFLPIYSFWCMDEFGWGNTRVVIGEGKDKKVIINEDEKFDESMIPLKKFSEYEAEAWESGSRHSDETGYSGKPRSTSKPPRSREVSPHPYQQASQTGDYYRDTNLTNNNSSNPNLRLGSQHSLSNLSHHAPSVYHAGGGVPPQIPFMPFGGGPGSVTGSDYGAPAMPMGMMGYQNTGSVYGMPMAMGAAPRNTMMSNFNMFGGSFGSQSDHSALPPPGMLGHTRPMSTFSAGTSVNAFMNSAPSMNPNPSDEELFTALRNYLSTQDLMTVTKKTAREAIAARFPKADLTSRKDFLNQSIDNILSES